VSNQAALATNLGTIQGDYLKNVGLNSFGLQQGAIQNVGQQQGDLAAKVAQLKLDKGDFGVSQRQQILGDEADAALKAALTNSQIGQNKAQAANTNATTAKTKTDTTKTKAELDFFKAHGYYPKTGPTAPKTPDTITSGPFAGYTKTQVAKMPQGKKDQIKRDYAKTGGKGGAGKDANGNTPKQQMAASDSLTKALVYARSAVKDKKHGPALAGDWKALARALVVGFNVNPTYANAAAQQVVLGRIGPNTTKQLKQRGAKVPGRGKPAVQQAVDQGLSDVNAVIQKLPG
jgi:hypothetical protein